MLEAKFPLSGELALEMAVNLYDIMRNEYVGIHFFGRSEKRFRKLCNKLPTGTFLTFSFLLLALPNLQQQLSAWQVDDLP